jgi:hypothetical protein
MTTTLLAVPTRVTAMEGTPKPKVAFVDAVDLPGEMEDTRAQLRNLVETAGRERGFEVTTPPAPPACRDASCLPELARALDVTDLLIARGGRTKGRDYHVELGLWQSSTGDVVPAVADCSFCTGPQMAEAVAKAARPLLDRVVAHHGAPPPQAAAPPASALAAPAVVKPSEKVGPGPGAKVAGWSLLGAGVALAAAGGIVWGLDGNGTDCVASSCRNTYRTRTEGIALIAAGVVGIGAGLWLELAPLGKRDVAIRVGPSGALIAGRF